MSVQIPTSFRYPKTWLIHEPGKDTRFFMVPTNSVSANSVTKLCQRILRQPIMCQQMLCPQIMCQQILCKQPLSTNYVNKFCPLNMWRNYVSTNYVNKLCQQIMSTNSVSITYVSTKYVNKFMSTNYVRKLCRQFNAAPGWSPHNYAVNITEFSHHGIYTSAIQQANHGVGRSLHPVVHTVTE